jgi:thiol:disulfide interchange protein DsbD
MHHCRTIAALSALCLLLAGCEVPIPTPSLPVTAPTLPTLPSTGDSDYDAALATARAQGKPIFLEFSAEWCTYCKQMERSTFSDAKVKEALSGYVTLFADSDTHRQLAHTFGVTGIPAYFVVDGSGKVLKKGDGYKPPTAFLAWLDGA